MRLITLVLATLLLLIQIPLWVGKGGWLRVGELETQLAGAQKHSAELKARNAKLDSEVRDLRDGKGAVEERARFELGMIKQNEIFIQILDPNDQPKEMATPLPPPKPDPKDKDGKPLARATP